MLQSSTALGELQAQFQNVDHVVESTKTSQASLERQLRETRDSATQGLARATDLVTRVNSLEDMIQKEVARVLVNMLKNVIAT